MCASGRWTEICTCLEVVFFTKVQNNEWGKNVYYHGRQDGANGLPKRAGRTHFARSGFPALVPQEKVPFLPTYKNYCWSSLLDIALNLIFFFFLASIYLAFVSTIAVLCSDVKHG